MLAEVSIHVLQLKKEQYIGQNWNSTSNQPWLKKDAAAPLPYKFDSTQQLAFWPNWNFIISIPVILLGLFGIRAS